MPDKKFPVIWTLFIIGFVVLFAVIESWALATGGTTLTRFIWELSKDWPLLPFVLGAFTGGLAAHLFWHWNPPG
jgi:hypothetical protein